MDYSLIDHPSNMAYDPVQMDIDAGIYKDILLVECFFVGLIGVILTGMLLSVLIKKFRKEYHVDTMLCSVVSALDFQICVGLIFRSIFCKWPYNLIVYHPWLCALGKRYERCLLIVFGINLHNYIWIGVIVIWVGYPIVHMIVMAFQNTIVFSQIGIYCTVSPNTPGFYTIHILSGMSIVAFFTVLFSYSAIIVSRYKAGIRAQRELNIDYKIARRQSIKTILRSLIIMLLYIIGYGGKLLSFSYETFTGRKRPWVLDYIATACIICNSLVNDLLILYFNTAVREEFFILLFRFYDYLIACNPMKMTLTSKSNISNNSGGRGKLEVLSEEDDELKLDINKPSDKEAL
ncbi:hypothetical protein CONCODRAFT_168553 [Conidiobolus coronatus NRRL 28638]|uniref:G-protein coupled receptors family 1 profile domain-containing protein n=1 Tax=Conidiobolus coronatus (strain ATCC 28846 / CBS 209.66 / NRRL 28638) TaxID=796925 RepID=A0A137NTV4_CONC2|nr:hypothetical protein CONCODRAFT_168553 [Conidiobolus coronatus NRRL 28638]|eukprot:KXN66223.1 hypothetical protein CONCODRAFT_168553 [Conidiobolus coronatus NRRL 28638]